MRLRIQPIANKGNCIFAERSFIVGEIIGCVEGIEVSLDSMYTLRLESTIIEPTCVLRYLAHSCDPNAHFKNKDRQLFALKTIGVGDEVTIDYLFTEPVITHPFVCKCGAPNCRMEIARTPLER